MVNAEARRLAGPVALLAAATVVALGARALLHDEARSATKPPSRAAAMPHRRSPPPAPPPAPAAPPAPATSEVVIEAGDTLGELAAAHGATVEELLLLNPGVDPSALHVGQRIRVPAADG